MNIKKDYLLCCREEIVTEQQNDKNNDNEAFAEKPDAIPGLGSPLVVVDDPTPPESPIAAADKPETDPVDSNTIVSNVNFGFGFLWQ